MRKPIIVGNWKMNKTNAQTKEFIDAVDSKLHEHADFGIATPYTALHTATSNAKNLLVAAQNVHFEPNGAYTGEVSVEMLQELNVQWVILGHSERRQYFNETDADINKKAKVLLEQGITPIVCVGETLEEFEANQTEDVVRRQVKESLTDLDPQKAQTLVVAYEPVWAIGTGKSATQEIAQNTCAIVRDELKNLFGTEVSEAIRIQYGGSVKGNNIAEYMAGKDIDGALVGGASLQPESFLELVEALNK